VIGAGTMTFDLQRIVVSKRAYRRYLMTLPIGEKLRILDALRKREIAIRRRELHSDVTSDRVREPLAPLWEESE